MFSHYTSLCPVFCTRQITKLSLSAALSPAAMETITCQGQNIDKNSDVKRFGGKKNIILAAFCIIFVRGGNVIVFSRLMGAGLAGEAEEGCVVPSWLSDSSSPPLRAPL